MPTLTTTTSTVGLLTNGLALIEQLDLPTDAGVSVDTYWRGRTSVDIHPDTVEQRRRIMQAPVFTGATWSRLGKGSDADVGGVHVHLHDAREGRT